MDRLLLFAVCVYVADEHPAFDASAGPTAGVMDPYGVVVVVGVCAGAGVGWGPGPGVTGDVFFPSEATYLSDTLNLAYLLSCVYCLTPVFML